MEQGIKETKEYYRFKNVEDYKLKLNSEPQEGWILTRDLGNGKKVSYMPIEMKESLADVIYREWNVVDEKYFNMLNEIVCTVKINALPDYPGADYETFTGSASKPIQTDSGSKADEFPKGKKTNALEYCLPAVRSEAIGCAFELKGNVFGRNVGRSASNNFGFKLQYKKD